MACNIVSNVPGGDDAAKKLVITAEDGGSNGHRVQVWKQELSRLAKETGLDIEIHHFPPGTQQNGRDQDHGKRQDQTVSSAGAGPDRRDGRTVGGSMAGAALSGINTLVSVSQS